MALKGLLKLSPTLVFLAFAPCHAHTVRYYAAHRSRMKKEIQECLHLAHGQRTGSQARNCRSARQALFGNGGGTIMAGGPDTRRYNIQ